MGVVLGLCRVVSLCSGPSVGARGQRSGAVPTFPAGCCPWDCGEHRTARISQRRPNRPGRLCLARDMGSFAEAQATGTRPFGRNKMVRNECFRNVPSLDIDTSHAGGYVCRNSCRDYNEDLC